MVGAEISSLFAMSGMAMIDFVSSSSRTRNTKVTVGQVPRYDADPPHRDSEFREPYRQPAFEDAANLSKPLSQQRRTSAYVRAVRES